MIVPLLFSAFAWTAIVFSIGYSTGKGKRPAQRKIFEPYYFRG